MLSYTLIFFSIVFIGETFFPSYTMCSTLESGEIACYGVSRKKVHELMGESGMIDMKKLVNSLE